MPDEKTKKIMKGSKWIVVLTAIVWSVWDVIPAMNQGRGDTISEAIRTWSRTAWVVPMGWGILTSHFFVNIGQPENYQLRFYVMSGFFVACIIANLIHSYYMGYVLSPAVRVGVMLFGMGIGMFFWPQNA